MSMSRRGFLALGAGATALGLGYWARRRQGDPSSAVPPLVRDDRSLVVVYLAGGNDALSFLVPYTDRAYYDRRPTLAVPADRVLQVGSDANGSPLGLHPNLPGLKAIFDRGHAVILQRVGYERASRSHFVGCDVLCAADPVRPQGDGWLGRYLDTLPAPADALSAWNTQFQLPRSLFADHVGVPSIVEPAAYTYLHPWGEADAVTALAAGRPGVDADLAFLNAVTTDALATIPRVAAVAPRNPTTPYPDTPLGATLRLVAAALAGQTGTKVFWVQAAGFDTHAGQGTLDGTYARLMSTLDGALAAFHDDLHNQGLLDRTLTLVCSEFARRIDENGSRGTDHGAAGLMVAVGGAVRGGLYGTAARLGRDKDNPDLENDGRDVRHETDFRAVYAHILDDWLGADSTAVLRGDFRSERMRFLQGA